MTRKYRKGRELSDTNEMEPGGRGGKCPYCSIQPVRSPAGGDGGGGVETGSGGVGG